MGAFSMRLPEVFRRILSKVYQQRVFPSCAPAPGGQEKSSAGPSIPLQHRRGPLTHGPRENNTQERQRRRGHVPGCTRMKSPTKKTCPATIMRCSPMSLRSATSSNVRTGFPSSLRRCAMVANASFDSHPEPAMAAQSSPVEPREEEWERACERTRTSTVTGWLFGDQLDQQ